MATYPGNASLSSAVKDRVLSTFQQAVTLYKQGRSAEVVEGCTLILRMDPTFDPARKLLEKTRNPNAAIDVDSLMPESGSGALREAHEALAARDFQRAADLTSEILRDDFTNEEARLLNDAAREKMEAAPFVEQFIRKAEMFVQQGNVGAARSELEKARALDDDHPGHPPRDRVDAAVRAGPGVVQRPEEALPSSSKRRRRPLPPGRSAAQATDFGFTFEEEKPARGFAGSAGSRSMLRHHRLLPRLPPAGFHSIHRHRLPRRRSSPFGGGFSFDTPSAPASGGFDFAPRRHPSDRRRSAKDPAVPGRRRSRGQRRRLPAGHRSLVPHFSDRRDE